MGSPPRISRVLGWVHALGACALLVPSAAQGQAGLLLRGFSAQAHCSPGPTAIGASCATLRCELPRICIELVELGAHCLDPENEIVCVPGDGGCDDCPMISTGADPEACRVVELVEGSHSLCFYHPRLVCLAENSFDLDALSCLPSTENEPSLAEGDCDGDGIPNGLDGCICDRAESCVGPGFDAGVGVIDASVLDASVLDGGPLDAALRDAAERDPDGARPDLDGASTLTPIFRGGGGCACSAAPASRHSASAALAVLALLAAWRCRSRASRRSRYSRACAARSRSSRSCSRSR